MKLKFFMTLPVIFFCLLTLTAGAVPVSRPPLVDPSIPLTSDSQINQMDFSYDPSTDHDGDTFPAATDCNDRNADIFPGREEIDSALCNDGIDNDCSGERDARDPHCAGLALNVNDLDSDSDGEYNLTDCDDANPTIYHGAPDIPGDGIDQDCTGHDATEDSTPTQGATHDAKDDYDGDGYCEGPNCYGVAGEDALKPGDCNDDDLRINPSIDDKCDGVDRNCDGMDGVKTRPADQQDKVVACDSLPAESVISTSANQDNKAETTKTLSCSLNTQVPANYSWVGMGFLILLFIGLKKVFMA